MNKDLRILVELSVYLGITIVFFISVVGYYFDVSNGYFWITISIANLALITANIFLIISRYFKRSIGQDED